MVFLPHNPAFNDQVRSDKGLVWRWDGMKWVCVSAEDTRDQPPSSEVTQNQVVNGNTRHIVNVPTKETDRIAIFAKESRGEAAGGSNQMSGTYTDEGNVPVNALPTPKRARRGFTRFLVAVGIGVAATLAWQSYGETTKQIIARRAPQLGWSPEAKQMIASSVRQLGWTPHAPQPAPVAQTAPAAAAPMASAAPSLDPHQVQQIARDLAEVRRAVEQLAASQGQMGGDIARLQAADQEILQRISALRPRPATVPAHIPTRPSSRPPIPQH
jgi:hypothetical protein